VGDVEQDTMMANIGFLEGLSVDASEMPLVEVNGTASANTLYLVDKPGAAQSEIRVGYLTQMPYDATGEYFKSSLMNYVLGGAFNSRINLNLREDKGYTYGARSGFSSTRIPGPFTASSSVRKDASAASVSEFMKEIQVFADDGITTQELAFMRAAIGQRDALNYETPRQKASFLARVLEYDLAADFVERQSEIIQSISKDEIDALANQQLPYGDMFILVVGDKAEIADSIAELGYPVIELGSDGVVLE
jgi:zinc protease